MILISLGRVEEKNKKEERRGVEKMMKKHLLGALSMNTDLWLDIYKKF